MFEESAFSYLARNVFALAAGCIEKLKDRRSSPAYPLDAYILFDKYLGIGDLLMVSPLIKAACESDKVRRCYVVTPWPKIVDVEAEFVGPEAFVKKLQGCKPYTVLLISPTPNMRHSIHLLTKQYLLGYFSNNCVYSNFEAVCFSFDPRLGHYADRIKPLLKWFGMSDISNRSYPPLSGCRKPNDSFTIVMAPFVRVRGRQWKLEKYSQLIAELLKEFSDAQIILLGSDYQEEREFNSRLSGVEGVVDLTGKTTLVEAIDIISGADMFISNDTGLAHIAYLSACHAFVVFGSVHPDTRLPYGGVNNHPVWEQNACEHFPCHNTMKRPRCINDKKYTCIDSIDISSVMETVRNVFRRSTVEN